MTLSLSDDQVRLLRMRSQLLGGDRATGVHEAVRAVGGLQAQNTHAARLAVRARSTGLDADAVTQACNRDRSVVRTWAMRGTLHMVAAEDVGWLVAMLGPKLAASGRRRRLQLGLDDDLCTRALPAIQTVLADEGPLIRSQLVRRLAELGVTIDPDSQASAHLVFYAAVRGLICRGPDREDDEPTYVLVTDWVGEQPAREPEAALAELTRRYVGAYGPASPDDFGRWSGLGVRQARRGFELVAGELRQVEVSGGPSWVLASAAVDDPGDAEACVRLLAHFDTYLLGYRSRDLILAPRFARRVQAGGGWIHPVVMVNGRVVGTWREQRQHSQIAVQPFERLDRATLASLEGEVADVGRFLGTEAALVVER